MDEWVEFWVVFWVRAQWSNVQCSFCDFIWCTPSHNIFRHPFKLRFTFVPFPHSHWNFYYTNTAPWHWLALICEIEHCHCARVFIGRFVLLPALIHIAEYPDMLPCCILSLDIQCPFSHSFVSWFWLRFTFPIQPTICLIILQWFSIRAGSRIYYQNYSSWTPHLLIDGGSLEVRPFPLPTAHQRFNINVCPPSSCAPPSPPLRLPFGLFFRYPLPFLIPLHNPHFCCTWS